MFLTGIMHKVAASVVNPALWKNRYLAIFLRTELCVDVPGIRYSALPRLGWGRKPSGLGAVAVGQHTGAGHLLLEDGFLRSLGLGVSGYAPHSLVLDKTGIYYDATCPSDLEQLILAADDDDMTDTRARRCISLIREQRLSKYNHAPDFAVLPADGRCRVLVVDQTYGDASVLYGGATDQSFIDMLDAAIAENPDSEVLVKVHPDVIAGKKKGYLLAAAKQRTCTLLAEDVNPWALFDGVDKVYVVTSQLGFEALMAGKQVCCFGLPFYAGWGLTEDKQQCPRRGVARTVEQVFVAAYLHYARYANPYTGQRCELEDTIALIADQKRQMNRLAGSWLGIGFSRWKQPFVRDFMGIGSRVEFSESATLNSNDSASVQRIIGWSSRINERLQQQCEERSIPLWRMEDGFVRSVGLGADLVRPMSLVLDSQGIYYDSTGPSDLEQLLATHPFATDLLERAAKVRQRLVELNLSKYNVGHSAQLDLPDNQRILLVPGQVETDASIAKGSPVIQTNLDLLHAARNANPDAYIIYKPHPDVLSGGRIGELPQNLAAPYDLLVTEIAMPVLLGQVDEVHTMSSLTGFEALLRELKVVTYGMPFYAGWGLTEDLLSCERRTRKLTLDQLVAATLILYPTYVEPDSGQICNVETIIELIDQRRGRVIGPSLKTRLYRLYRKLFEGRV